MKSKTKNLIAMVPLTIAAIATVTTVVYLYASGDSENPKPGTDPAKAATSSESQKISDRPAVAPSEISEANGEEKPRNAAERLAYSLSSEQHDRLLTLINDGAVKDLLKIHGVGKTRAEAILAARPFGSVTELTKVNGVGEITFARVIEYGKQLGVNETVVASAPTSIR